MKKWIQEELANLKAFCKASHSFPELKEKTKGMDRTWQAIRAKVYQNKNWFSHFDNKEKFLNFLKEEDKRPKPFDKISKLLDIPKEGIFPLADDLGEEGFEIEVNRQESMVRLVSEPTAGKVKRIPKISSNVVKVLFLSDLCLGLKTQQLSLVETAYKFGEEAGVFFAVICGNIVAGKPPKAHEGEYFLLTYEEQLEYAVKHLPKASFKTTFLNGPRELSWLKVNKGNIGEDLAKARTDLSYKANLKSNFPIGNKEKTNISVIYADSSAYTKSYVSQGIAENLQEAERYVFEHSESFQAIIIGGAHTAQLDPRRHPIKKTRINDFCKINVPSLCRTTPSQAVSKKRGASQVLGCAIVSFELDEEGYLKSLPNPKFHNLTSYFKDNEYLEDFEETLADSLNDLGDKEKELVEALSKKPRRLGALARIMGISGDHIKDIIKNLCEKDFDIDFDEASKSYKWERSLREEFKPLDTKQLCVKKVKVGSFSDSHLGHKNARPDLIGEVYKIFEAEKVDAVFHSGDGFEGDGAYKGQERELELFGADAQLNCGLEAFPASKIPTFIIMGSSHEKVFLDKSGHDIVNTFTRLARAEKGINITALLDKDGITGSHGVVDIKGIKFGLDHPSGGLPYGKSYRPQKSIENLVSEMELSGEAKITLYGHLHVAFFMLYKGIAAFLVPCLEETTKYIKQKGYTSYLGCWVIEVGMDQYENITELSPQYFPFEPIQHDQVYQISN